MQTVNKALFKSITIHITGQNKTLWNSWLSIKSMTTSAFSSKCRKIGHVNVIPASR